MLLKRNKRQRGELRVNNLSEQYKEMKEELAAALMDSHQQKQWHKAQKKKHKQEAKAAKAKAKLGEVATDSKPRVWVLDFKGSMDAHEVNSLREEITAVLAAFKPQDSGCAPSGKPWWHGAWLRAGGFATAASAR
ncbi:protease [Escherichia coli]|nr:protease [Escherichia coli]